jgi:hypothetical protein
MFDVGNSMTQSNIEHQITNIEHQITNIEHRTSKLQTDPDTACGLARTWVMGRRIPGVLKDALAQRGIGVIE